MGDGFCFASAFYMSTEMNIIKYIQKSPTNVVSCFPASVVLEDTKMRQKWMLSANQPWTTHTYVHAHRTRTILEI